MIDFLLTECINKFDMVHIGITIVVSLIAFLAGYVGGTIMRK